jgi:squalene-hopene/tetraprenyl-beta-curcumene cyclase
MRNLVFPYCLFFYFMTVALAEKQPAIKSGVDQSLFQEARHSVSIALDWLQKSQTPEGFWTNKEQPALSALALRSFLHADKAGVSILKYDSTIAKGFRYLESCVQKDGGIYIKGYENYNTAIAMIAFLSANNPNYRQIIVNANNYLVGMQMDEKEKGKSDYQFDGGIGYNKDGHSDMNNTTWSLEAIYLAKQQQPKPSQEPEKKDVTQQKEMKDLNWQAAIDFISRCQNLAKTNPASWVSEDSINKGGFLYYPGSTKADPKDVNGKKVLPSYGTMSLAGIMALLFADVPKQDIRIQEAFKWLQKNYTLDENPGLGQQGIYFYYYIMAKSLKIYGVDTLQVKGKESVLWRKKLLERLVSLQKKDGFWQNTNGRWWENDPVLATTYALLAAEIAIP